MPDGQHRKFEVWPVRKLEQLFSNLCDQWKAKDLETNAHIRLAELAGEHAGGQEPNEARPRGCTDSEGREQYFVRVFGAGIHYAVDESMKILWITRIDMPRW